MDILHLPPALRRTLLTKSLLPTPLFCRHLTNHALSTLDTPSPPTTTLLSLSPGTLNSYNLSPPPTPAALKTAAAFFTRHAPPILYSAAHFRSFPPSPFPEVAFLGRSNVGKSSLLNALLGRPKDKPAHVSKRPGRTRTMNGFGVGGEGVVGQKTKGGGKQVSEHGVSAAWKQFGKGGMVVVDMPGYGGGSRDEWGTEIMKYLSNRKQLRRTYVLVDSEHGLKNSDIQLLLHLRQEGIAHQIVLSKVDKLLYPNAKAPGAQGLHNRLLKLQDTCADLRQKLNKAAGAAGGRDDLLGDILCCSAEKSLEDRGKTKRIGIDEIRWSVLTACGMEAEAATTMKPTRGERRTNAMRSADDAEDEEGWVKFTP